MVIAPANTGNDSKSRMAVMKTDQTNKGQRSIVIPGARMLITVEIKLIAPRIEDAPARCREKIARSTAPPLWAILLLRGG
jgi:hypothetical protein